MLDENEQSNNYMVSTVSQLIMCCEASLAYLLFSNHLDKTQLIEELKRVIAKARHGK